MFLPSLLTCCLETKSTVLPGLGQQKKTSYKVLCVASSPPQNEGPCAMFLTCFTSLPPLLHGQKERHL